MSPPTATPSTTTTTTTRTALLALRQQQDQQLQLEGQTEMDSVVAAVKTEIKAYGKANGYSYILGGGDGGSVLYGREADDLTAEILKLLNDKYKK